MDNKDTHLVFEDFEYSTMITGSYSGIGFSTNIDGKSYRGAVKIPKDSNHDFWKKAFLRLISMLDDPINPDNKCVSGNKVLIGNEVEIY